MGPGGSYREFPGLISLLRSLSRQSFPCSLHRRLEFLLQHFAGREIGKIFRDMNPGFIELQEADLFLVCTSTKDQSKGLFLARFFLVLLQAT